MQLISILFIIFSTCFHDLHLSMCNLSFNSEKSRIEFQQRIFYDDLEKSMQMKLNDKNFDILSAETSEINFDSLFHDYLLNKIELKVNSNLVKLDFLEYEINQDAIVFYLYKENITQISEIHLHSSILFELYEDQTNVVSVKVGNQKKSGRININSNSISFLF